MVVAKTARALTVLSRHFHRRMVEKRYAAIVRGVVEEDDATIIAPIGRDPERRPRWWVMESGRHAETRLHVLKRGERISLLELEPVTGRTNQIRVHLAHLGAPVVGDRTYRRRGATVPDPDFAARVAALGGQALHAAVLGFTHPTTGARHRFEAPPPPAFTALLTWLRGLPGSAGPAPRVR